MKQATILTEFESLILKIFFCMMLKYIHNENSTYEPLLLVFVIDLCIVVFIYIPNDTITLPRLLYTYLLRSAINLKLYLRCRDSFLTEMISHSIRMNQL